MFQCPCCKLHLPWREQFANDCISKKEECQFDTQVVTLQGYVAHLQEKAHKGGYLHKITLEYLKHLYKDVSELRQKYIEPGKGKRNKSNTRKNPSGQTISSKRIEGLIQYKQDRRNGFHPRRHTNPSH